MSITFTTGLMGAGKSKNLIKFYNDSPVFKIAFAASLDQPTGRDGEITSRDGNLIYAFCLGQGEEKEVESIIKLLSYSDKFFIDESQFLSTSSVKKIIQICDESQTDVHFFGLLKTFTDDFFESSKLLLEAVPKENILHLTRYCETPGCKNIAEHNARMVNGKIVKNGDTFLVEKSNYLAVCKKCYFR